MADAQWMGAGPAPSLPSAGDLANLSFPDINPFAGSDGVGNLEFPDINIDFGGATPAPPVAAAPLVTSGASAPDAGFASGLGEGLTTTYEDAKQIVTHPVDTAVGVYRMGKAIWDNELDMGTAFRQMVDGIVEEAKTNPTYAAGRFIGEGLPFIVTSIASGGTLGAVTKLPKVQKLLKMDTPKGRIARDLGIVTAGASAGAIENMAFAAARAERTGQDMPPDEAALVAAMGFTLGGVATSMAAKTGITSNIKNTIKASAPETVAAFKFPREYFEKLAERGVGAAKAPLRDLKELSRIQRKIANHVALFNREVEALYERLTKPEIDSLMEALRKTDENWFFHRDAEQSSVISYVGPKRYELTPEEMAPLNMTPAAKKAYNDLLDKTFDLQKQRYEAMRREGIDMTDAAQPMRGLLPHRWNGAHRVISFNELGEPVVHATDSMLHARELAQQLNGKILDAGRVSQMALDEAIHAVTASGVKDLETFEKFVMEIERLQGGPKGRLAAMAKARRGARGYSSLNTIRDFAQAVTDDYHSMLMSTKLATVTDRLTASLPYLQGVDFGVAREVVKSAVERAVGIRTSRQWASTTRGMLFHAVLGSYNFVAPTLNYLSSIGFAPAHLRETVKALGLQDKELSIFKAYLITAKAIPAMFPPKLRKLVGYSSRAEREILRNEASGATPTVGGTSLPDSRIRSGDTGDSRWSDVKRKAAVANTWFMLHSETSARRGVGMMFREVGKDMGLKGAELDKFVAAGVSRTAVDFERGMRAAIFEGGTNVTDIAAVALTFQSYIARKFLIDLPRVVKNDPVAALSILSTVWFMGGLNGIPALETFLDYIVEKSDASGELVRDWEAFKAAHPYVWRGPLHDVGGVDMGARAAGSFPMGVGSEFGVSPLGVVGSKIKSGFNSEGADSVNAISPADIRRRIAAAGSLLSPDGEYPVPTGGTHKPTHKLDRTEAAMTLLTGLEPTKVSTMRNMKSADFNATVRRSDSISALKNLLVRDMVANNGKATPERQRTVLKRLFTVDPSMRSLSNRRKFLASADRMTKERLQMAGPRATGPSTKRLLQKPQEE